MAIEDWQQFVQSVFIGLIFSFLLAKLISVVTSFREENLTVVRERNDLKSSERESGSGDDDSGAFNDVNSRVSEEDSMIAEKGSVRSESLLGEGGDDDDDDWEGVESTELDEAFSAATAFVAASAADRLSQKVSNDVQLLLYGLYKIATEGPCTTAQPSALKMTARAKWQAWQKLGAMPPEEAMQKYIDIVTELYPSWASGSTKEHKHGNSDAPSTDAKGPMGPVLSTFVYEEESGNELKMDDIHAFAREGEGDNLLKCIESGVSVNQKDSEGRAPLHWAVDRGHLNIAELLVSRNADVNMKAKRRYIMPLCAREKQLLNSL
ncbi:acyl-CoA-binding domain-containing protein 1-like isoform X2 [Malania oleifera]|uniref:acyl-CoA-binding domain-containing protein 1-like isoform X2 n=1 Tax=Malania oleifera TaxID=397392 RepID=UPI0025AE3C8D|nr:acyl-CoA-binding domain-containing protein 1-like isoform X2 [Malania oleifera]